MKALKVEKEKVDVVIYTQHHRIEGTIHPHPSTRLTDFMNITTGSGFIPITDAKIYSLPDERLLYSVDFLNINKNYIIMIFPKTTASS